MALGVIITILLVGLLLIFLEIFFIPGTTLFGVLGGVAVVLGVVLMYAYYGRNYGNVSLAFSAVAVVLSVIAGFKLIDSNKLAMKAEIKGKVNELESHLFNLGDTGVTVTDLRPNGKAMINTTKVDVYSSGDFINRDTPIEISKITNDKIFVKQLNA